jgi:hypothetical protein
MIETKEQYKCIGANLPENKGRGHHINNFNKSYTNENFQ